jgi:hypothetical protein
MQVSIWKITGENTRESTRRVYSFADLAQPLMGSCMTQTTVNKYDTDIPPFDEHLRATVGEVRGSIVELMASVGADPNKPQDIARRFGLRKSLTWKVCKIVQEETLYGAVPHIPGSSGMNLFISAFERAGADPARVETARDAAGQFDRMVEVHTGDRQTLMTMLAELDPRAQRAQREADRKLAFQGASSTWGIQARVKLDLQLIAPNVDEPHLIDHAGVAGYIDMRRLRRSASWPLLRNYSYNDDGSVRQDVRTPIDPAIQDPDALPLLAEFCSEPMPEVRRVEQREGCRYELCQGPVGNTAAFTCLFGSYSRRFACIYRDEVNRVGDHPSLHWTPTELSILDVLIHRDLPLELPPTAHAFGCLFTGLDNPLPGREEDRVPLTEPVLHLGEGPPVVATPHLPNYPGIVRRVMKTMDWDLGEFRGYRFMMKYPPIPSVIVMRYPLPDRPA